MIYIYYHILIYGATICYNIYNETTYSTIQLETPLFTMGVPPILDIFYGQAGDAHILFFDSWISSHS